MERPQDSGLRIAVDRETGCRYIVWRPMVAIGLGATEREALEDLRDAAHAGIDGLIAEKYRDLERAGPSAERSNV